MNETIEFRLLQERDATGNPCGWTLQVRTRAISIGALGAFAGLGDWSAWRNIPIVEAQ